MVKTTKNNKIRQKGFTLIELLVAITIFAVFITVGASSLVDILRQDQKVSVLRSTQEETRYILESIAREARSANGELNSAGERVGVAYQVSGSQLWILSTDFKTNKVTKKIYYIKPSVIDSTKNEFRLATYTKDVMVSTPTVFTFANSKEIALNNNDNLDIVSFNFTVSPPDPADTQNLIPPELNITLNTKSGDRRSGTKPENRANVELKTAVSPRNY